MVLEKILFYLRLAVGLLTVWIVLTLFNKLGGWVWGWPSSLIVGADGSIGSTPSEALKSAMKETIEALVAIGFAVLVCCWHVLKEQVWRRLWRRNALPEPGPGPEPDSRMSKLKELLSRLKNLRK